jgi:hypothetical protein
MQMKRLSTLPDWQRPEKVRSVHPDPARKASSQSLLKYQEAAKNEVFLE